MRDCALDQTSGFGRCRQMPAELQRSDQIACDSLIRSGREDFADPPRPHLQKRIAPARKGASAAGRAERKSAIWLPFAKQADRGQGERAEGRERAESFDPAIGEHRKIPPQPESEVA